MWHENLCAYAYWLIEERVCVCVCVCVYLNLDEEVSQVLFELRDVLVEVEQSLHKHAHLQTGESNKHQVWPSKLYMQEV